MNPFTITGRAPENFCNRTAEIAALQNYFRSGNHVVLYAPRRYGKSSLAVKVQSTLYDMETLYVDLFSVTSLDEVTRLIYQEIANRLGREAAKKPAILKRLAEFFSRVRFAMTIGTDGIPSFDVSLGDTSPPLCLKEVITALDAWCIKSGRRVSLVMDEFQEICELKESKQIEAFLREGMQSSRMVSFLFMGSRRTILRDMFENRSRPFYKSAIKMELDRIPQEEFARFVADRFADAGRPIPYEDALEMVAYTDAYPYYTQKLALFHYNALESGPALLKDSCAILLKSEGSDFENIFVNLAQNQKKLLKAIARKPTASIYAVDYLREMQLGAASSVKAALKRLCELDLVEQHSGIWRTVDPILGKWLS